MGVAMLLDGVKGDPEALYKIVIEEISKRNLPEVTFGYAEELESLKFFFNKGDRAQALTITFRGQQVRVLGYQIGTIFHVSARTTYHAEDRGKLQRGFLYRITTDVYEEVVSRSVKNAVKRILEAQQAPVPDELDLRSIFVGAQESSPAEAAAS